MKVLEILQDLIVQAQQAQQSSGVTINIGSVNINTPAEQAEPEPDETGTMVPPLQQKIELLKKNAGLDNVYDQQQDEDDPIDG
jgi:hypothetical protein